MKVAIILFSVISLINAQVRIKCNEGKGECKISSDCKTFKGVDERFLF